MKITGIILIVLGVLASIAAVVLGFVLGWQCLLALFAVGGSFAVAKGAFISTIVCAFGGKVILQIGAGLVKAEYN